jgi:hypothetical protein
MKPAAAVPALRHTRFRWLYQSVFNKMAKVRNLTVIFDEGKESGLMIVLTDEADEKAAEELADKCSLRLRVGQVAQYKYEIRKVVGPFKSEKTAKEIQDLIRIRSDQLRAGR